MNENVSTSSTFRTRCAPSPTGFLHIGGLKTFFFAYLLAKQNKGKWILRIEDTDQSRKVEGAVEAILRGFAWAGLELDEGPLLRQPPTPRLRRSGGSGGQADEIVEQGEYGPYTQSKRLPLYKKYAQELVDKGFAYPCLCSPERLEEMRRIQQRNKQAPKYDRLCLRLPADEVAARLASGEKHVIRMKVPEHRGIVVDDQIKGRVVTNSSELDDQVLLKSDGFPTYHLAVVVDDHLMAITHIVRADEWLPSTPKHILLYEAFGWPLPVYAHVPPLLAPGGKKKLSKREGAVSVDAFAAQGYLPEAMLNYLVLLGWNPGTTQEIFTMEEMIAQFSLRRCQKAGAVFDIQRLNWMNGQYVRAMSVEELVRRLVRYWNEWQSGGETARSEQRTAISNQRKQENPTDGDAPLRPGSREGENRNVVASNEHDPSKHHATRACPGLDPGGGGGIFENSKFQIPNSEFTANRPLLTAAVAEIQPRLEKLSDAADMLAPFFSLPEYDASLILNAKMKVTKEIALDVLQATKQRFEQTSDWTKENLQNILQDLVAEKGYSNGQVFWPVRAALSGCATSPGAFEMAYVLGEGETLFRFDKALQAIGHL